MKGSPDWGQFAPKATVAPLQDMGELAARLGSIVTFDRRGDVVKLDDFEGGLVQWTTRVTGTGASITSDTARARNGSKSCKMIPGDADQDVAEIRGGLPYPRLSNFGSEISFTNNYEISHYTWEFSVTDGATNYVGEIKYDQINGKLQYKDSAGTFQDFATEIFLVTKSWLFNTLKMVVNLTTKKYLRIIFNETEYDLSAYALRALANPTNPRIEMKFTVYNSDEATNPIIFVDDVIITQNEP